METLGVILCGGKGSRLGDVGELIPKPIITFDGLPFIRYIIKQLENCVDKVVVVNPKDDNSLGEYLKTVEFIEAENSIPRSIHTIGKSDLDFDTLVICYGDTIADINIKDLIDFHTKNEADLTVTTYKMKSDFGVVECCGDDIIVKHFEEKPMLPIKINIGYMVINRDVINPYFNTDNLSTAFNDIIFIGKLCAYHHQGLHFTYNTMNDVRKLKQDEKFFNLIRRIRYGRE